MKNKKQNKHTKTLVIHITVLSKPPIIIALHLHHLDRPYLVLLLYFPKPFLWSSEKNQTSSNDVTIALEHYQSIGNLIIGHITCTHICVSVKLFLPFVFLVLPVPPVIKVDSDPAWLQKEGETTQFLLFILKSLVHIYIAIYYIYCWEGSLYLPIVNFIVHLDIHLNSQITGITPMFYI